MESWTGPGCEPRRLSCFSYFNRPSSNHERDSQPVGRSRLLDLGLVDVLAFELHRHVDSDLRRDAIGVKEVIFVDVDVDVDVVVSDAEVVCRSQTLLLRRSVKRRQTVDFVVAVLCRWSSMTTADVDVFAAFVVVDLEAIDVGLLHVVVGARLRLFEAGAILTEPVERNQTSIKDPNFAATIDLIKIKSFCRTSLPLSSTR